MLPCRFSRLATLAGVLFVLGCGGGSGVQTAAVSGKVTLNGDPLAGAKVYFASEEGSFVGFGVTDDEGVYRLAQGAIPGPNKVFISKIVGELPAGFSDDPEAGMDRGQLEAAAAALPPGSRGPKPPRDLVPSEFNSLKTTKLSWSVEPGANTNVNFDL